MINQNLKMHNSIFDLLGILECNDNFRGFGGMCLPKDVSAMANLMKETGVDFYDDLLDEINRNPSLGFTLKGYFCS